MESWIADRDIKDIVIQIIYDLQPEGPGCLKELELRLSKTALNYD
jgi:hypothetical protein